MAMLPSGEWVDDGTSGTSGVSSKFNDAAVIALLEGMKASKEDTSSSADQNKPNPVQTPESSTPSDDFANASQIIKEVKEGIDKYLAATTLGIIPSDEELVEIYVNIQMGIAQAEADAAAAKLKEEEAKAVSEAYKVEREAKIQAAVKAQLEEVEALKTYEEAVKKKEAMTPEEKQRQAAEALKASAANMTSTGIGTFLNTTPVTSIETEVANAKANLEAKKQAAKTLTETLHKLKPPRASNPDVVKIQDVEWKEFQEKISLKKEKIQKTNQELNKALETSEKLKKEAITAVLQNGGMNLTNSAAKKTPAELATEKRWMNSLNDVEIAKYEFTAAKQEWYDLRPPGEVALEIDLTANEQKEIVEEQKKLAKANITKGPGSFEFKNKIATLKATVSEINDTVKDMAKELATSIADSLMPTMIAPGAPNPLSSALRLLINTMRIKRSIDTILRLTSRLLGIALELGIADHPAIEKIANLVKPMLELKAKAEEETEKASSNADKPVDKTTYKAKSPSTGADITGPQIEKEAQDERFKDKNVDIYNWPLTDEGLRRLEKMKKKDKGDNKFAQWADTFKAYNDWLAALKGVN